jgi:hypothetical protein
MSISNRFYSAVSCQLKVLKQLLMTIAISALLLYPPSLQYPALSALLCPEALILGCNSKLDSELVKNRRTAEARTPQWAA